MAPKIKQLHANLWMRKSGIMAEVPSLGTAWYPVVLLEVLLGLFHGMGYAVHLL